MNNPDKSISVTEPVGLSIDKVKVILFKPFEIEKWFVIGFCAFLAGLFHATGRMGINGGGNNSCSGENQLPPELTNFWHDHMAVIIIVGSILAVLMIAIATVMLWLSSRGQFMLLDCLVKNKAQIKKPWAKFKTQANSLFWFRLSVILITAVFTLPIYIASSYVFSFLKEGNANALIFGLSIAIVVLVAIVIASIFGTVRLLTFDFVVPLMYRHGIGVLSAWGRIWTLFWGNIWKMTLYLLFKALIVFCIGTIAMLVVCAGCCFFCISIFFLMPYISSVVFLPLTSFLRLYPVYYLRQYGEEFDVFIAEQT